MIVLYCNVNKAGWMLVDGSRNRQRLLSTMSLNGQSFAFPRPALQPCVSIGSCGAGNSNAFSLEVCRVKILIIKVMIATSLATCEKT